MNRETAGTGGIREVRSRRLANGALFVAITGVLLEPIPRARAPSYNKRLPTGSSIGLPDYELAHLWGPGFGDESSDGIMYAPRRVNQEWQNRGIERVLRDLRTVAAREGGAIEVEATAAAHPLATHRGHWLLAELSYRFGLRAGRSRRWAGRVEMVVGSPPAPQVEPLVMLPGLF